MLSYIAVFVVVYVLQDEDDDVVDPHLIRVKNEAGGDESDEHVFSSFYLSLFSMGMCY